MMDISPVYLVIGGLALGIFWMTRSLIKARDSAHWPKVTGRVIHSSVEKSRDRQRVDKGDGDYKYRYRTMWEPKVTYEYEVDGVRYTGSNIYGFSTKTTKQQQANNTARRYAEGTTPDVYYNPDDPEDARLQVGLPHGWWKTMALLGFLLVMAILGAISEARGGLFSF